MGKRELALITLLALLNIYVYYTMDVRVNHLQEELASTKSQLDIYQHILNKEIVEVTSTIKRIGTLELDRRWIGETSQDFLDFGEPVNVIYCFYENSSIILDFQLVTADDVYIPFTIQRGDAFNLNDATETIPESLDRYAPIIYELNVSSSREVRVPLMETGWYTLSIQGRWTLYSGHEGIGITIRDGSIDALPVYVKVEYHIETPNDSYDYFACKQPVYNVVR